ncbi:MAG: glycosyltransferase family 2 protein [Candidatus Omnitrophota bacterium]
MITLVIPCFNEQENLPLLYEKIIKAAEEWKEPFEVIIIDDGSNDSTWEILKQFHTKDVRWKALRFSRNFGHQKAISAGLFYAGGDCAVILDADLQDSPGEVRRFIEKWKEGYEVIYAIRLKRKENFFKRVSYKIFYRILGCLSDIKIPYDSGDFCLIDRKVIDVLNSIREQDRFVRGLRAWIGFRQVGIKYERNIRHAGKPKFTLRKLKNLAFSGIFSFSIVPLQIATYLGLIICATTFLLAIFYFFKHFSVQPHYILIIAFFLGGAQLLCLGVLGEYIGRIYNEVRNRPLWIIRDTLGINIKKHFNSL